MNHELQEYRKEINNIDNQIMELLSKRQKVVNNVSDLKSDSLKNSFIMPQREKSMIQLLQKQNPNIDPHLIQYLWRGIISYSLYSEKPFKIHLSKQCKSAELLAYFPSPIPKNFHPDITSIVNNIKNTTNDLIVLNYNEVIDNYKVITKNNFFCFKRFSTDKSLVFGVIKPEFLANEVNLYIEGINNGKDASNSLYKKDDLIIIERNEKDLNSLYIGSY
ncbi:MAG: chorismate mutase [Rickettsiales bacterium]|jgi:chorismate mutase|nr:chorismate mutase [Rickettsiales bacterium]